MNEHQQVSFTKLVQQRRYMTILCTVHEIQEAEMCPQLELAGRLRGCVNTKFELEFKRVFVKAAVSRAVRLRECSLRELRLYPKLKRHRFRDIS